MFYQGKNLIPIFSMPQMLQSQPQPHLPSAPSGFKIKNYEYYLTPVNENRNSCTYNNKLNSNNANFMSNQINEPHFKYNLNDLESSSSSCRIISANLNEPKKTFKSATLKPNYTPSSFQTNQVNVKVAPTKFSPDDTHTIINKGSNTNNSKFGKYQFNRPINQFKFNDWKVMKPLLKNSLNKKFDLYVFLVERGKTKTSDSDEKEKSDNGNYYSSSSTPSSRIMSGGRSRSKSRLNSLFNQVAGSVSSKRHGNEKNKEEDKHKFKEPDSNIPESNLVSDKHRKKDIPVKAQSPIIKHAKMTKNDDNNCKTSISTPTVSKTNESKSLNRQKEQSQPKESKRGFTSLIDELKNKFESVENKNRMISSLKRNSRMLVNEEEIRIEIDKKSNQDVKKSASFENNVITFPSVSSIDHSNESITRIKENYKLKTQNDHRIMSSSPVSHALPPPPPPAPPLPPPLSSVNRTRQSLNFNSLLPPMPPSPNKNKLRNNSSSNYPLSYSPTSVLTSKSKANSIPSIPPSELSDNHVPPPPPPPPPPPSSFVRPPASFISTIVTQSSSSSITKVSMPTLKNKSISLSHADQHQPHQQKPSFLNEIQAGEFKLKKTPFTNDKSKPII